eukprot:COSAG01_NODE_1298_length_10837_cov_44.666108_9_plen_179_part_00
MAARPVAAAGRCGQPGLARARDDFQLGGMLKIPLFAAPAVKFRKTVASAAPVKSVGESSDRQNTSASFLTCDRTCLRFRNKSLCGSGGVVATHAGRRPSCWDGRQPALAGRGAPGRGFVSSARGFHPPSSGWPYSRYRIRLGTWPVAKGGRNAIPFGPRSLHTYMPHKTFPRKPQDRF